MERGGTRWVSLEFKLLPGFERGDGLEDEFLEINQIQHNQARRYISS